MTGALHDDRLFALDPLTDVESDDGGDRSEIHPTNMSVRANATPKSKIQGSIRRLGRQIDDPVKRAQKSPREGKRKQARAFGRGQPKYNLKYDDESDIIQSTRYHPSNEEHIAVLTDSELSDIELSTSGKRKGKQKLNVTPAKKLKTNPADSFRDLLSSTTKFIGHSHRRWALKDLREFVYIHLGADGNSSPNRPGYWWPARVLMKDIIHNKLTVSLYGDDGYGVDRQLSIKKPSETTVNNWQRANSSADFMDGKLITDISRSELKTRWDCANETMKSALPQELRVQMSQSSLTDSVLSPPLTPTDDHSQKESKFVRGMEDELDGSLELPGETVFAREPIKGSRLLYWPAIVHKFLPADPEDPKDFNGYLITFFDKTEAKVPRDHFYSSLDEGFTTCLLGNYTTEVGDNHIARKDNAPSRSPTPEPITPNLSLKGNGVAFLQLSIEEQIRYVYPVLGAMIRGEFVPGKEDHKQFLDGSSSRRMVIRKAGDIGRFSSNEVTNILYELKRWALRDERKAQMIIMGEVGAEHVNGGNVPGSEHSSSRSKHPPRPVGDEGYEALTPSDRLQYCTDILLRQALIQLLEWRDGARSTTNLLPPDEEQELYERYEKMLAEGNWWLDIVERRNMMIKTKPQGTPSGSRSGRRYK